MLTKEVREWMQKVERGQYSFEDAMNEFVNFSRYLTLSEIKMIKRHLEENMPH